METQTNTVNNYIQQVLLSRDTRTAQQMFTDLFAECITALEREPHNIQLCAEAYAIIQAYCKLGLPWQEQFTEFLHKAQLPCPKRDELCCKATKEALRKLILWNSCRKNQLLPNKQELITLVYEMITGTAGIQHNYTFADGAHRYRLYYVQKSWYWQDVHKQLTWRFKK